MNYEDFQRIKQVVAHLCGVAPGVSATTLPDESLSLFADHHSVISAESEYISTGSEHEAELQAH